MPRMTAKSYGTPMVDRRKARPRICSRYSRFAMRSVLRIGLASDGANEDFFKRRLNELEAVNLGGRRGLAQEFLRVAAGLQANLGVTGKVFCFRDLRRVEERGVAFEFNDDLVALVAILDLAHGSGENCFAIVDEADGIAKLFHLVHAMRGKEHGGAFGFE